MPINYKQSVPLCNKEGFFTTLESPNSQTEQIRTRSSIAYLETSQRVNKLTNRQNFNSNPQLKSKPRNCQPNHESQKSEISRNQARGASKQGIKRFFLFLVCSIKTLFRRPISAKHTPKKKKKNFHYFRVRKTKYIARKEKKKKEILR